MAKKRKMLKTTKSGKFDNRQKGAKEANFIWDLFVLLFHFYRYGFGNFVSVDCMNDIK